jgi:hypothetical protein
MKAAFATLPALTVHLPLRHLPQLASYTEKALAELPQSTVALAEECPAGTRADFVEAVKTLAAALPHGGSPTALDERQDAWATFVVCPTSTWRHVFGKRAAVVAHRDPAKHRALQTWEHHCSDGSVHCVGHFFRRHRQRCVALVRVCLW